MVLDVLSYVRATERRLLIHVPNPAHAQFIARESSDPLDATREMMRRAAAVIHHSGQGSQYTAPAFGKRCGEAGVRPSMGSAGDCFDNTMCESFFATLECELLNRRSFKSQGRSAHRDL